MQLLGPHQSALVALTEDGSDGSICARVTAADLGVDVVIGLGGSRRFSVLHLSQVNIKKIIFKAGNIAFEGIPPVINKYKFDLVNIVKRTWPKDTWGF
jgi:hypothetical protein